MGVLAFVFLDFVIAPIKQQGYSQIKHMIAEYFLSPTNGALLGPNCGADFEVRRQEMQPLRGVKDGYEGAT